MAANQRVTKLHSSKIHNDDDIDGDFLKEGEEEERRALEREAIKEAQVALTIEETWQEPNLVERAKALAKLEAFKIPEYRNVKVGDSLVTKADNTTINRWSVWNALYDPTQRPYLDLFRGRIVDHKGVIIDDRYPISEQLYVLKAAGLSGQSPDTVRKDFREWALTKKQNSQIELMNRIVPQWDGVPRMEKKLIQLFQPLDTSLNREFGRYFWLALYCRIMHPGCLSSIVLSLIGGQNAGKSYFSKLLCEVLMNDPDADSIPWDLSSDPLQRLRDITGRSLIANIGEMNGFSKGAIEKVNNLITRTKDPLDYKYEGGFEQLRQWLFIMDGNKYVGLQRDETGNRRFYPVFVGQLPDENGQPRWKEVYRTDFTNFKEDVLQIMAECRDWLENNGGVKGYERLDAAISKKVFEFNKAERLSDRGTVRDPNLEKFFMAVIRECDKQTLLERKGDKRTGVTIKAVDFGEVYSKKSRGERVNWDRTKIKISSIGGEEKRLPGNIPGYFFAGFESIAAFHEHLDSLGDDFDTIETGEDQGF